MANTKRTLTIGAFLGLVSLAPPTFGQTVMQSGTLSISSQDIPYTGDAGTYEQIYTVKTPFGKLNVYTNIDNGKITYVSASSDQSEHVLLFSKAIDQPAPASFYGQDITKTSETASIFMDGSTYFLPIEANPGGNCNPGSDVYIVKWTPHGPPVISPLVSLENKDCIQADYVRAKNSELNISILSGDDLKIENWQYEGAANSITRMSSTFYHSPTNFVPLISQETPVVKSITTRYGKLTLDPNAGIMLNDAVQNFPGNPGIDYQGFASKVFQDDDKDIVVAVAEPDEATGLVFQVLTITSDNINLSKYFGSGFNYLSYKSDGGNILFDVGEYSPNAPRFLDQNFQLSNGILTGLDTRARIVPSTSLPADIGVVSDTWYVLTNTDVCVAVPYSPADLIDRDRTNALMDDVQVLLSDVQGKPVIVRVSEPESGGLEESLVFFRGDSYCVQYKTRQDNQINQLK
ncbi:MAG: hypothetical protein KGH75_04225 [Rhodospirillales bacterium]|nr:hypothetical protein [Rhodospirillales bacterium]